jgi:AAA domain-containing protein
MNALEAAELIEDLPTIVRKNRLELTCATLASVERTEIEWLWRDRIPKNALTIVEGDGGRGKSTIIAELCSRLSKGERLIDDDQDRPSHNILLLAAEDDPSCVLRPRFEACGADLNRIRFDDQSMILNEDGIEALTEAIKKHSINIVVIDPIVSFLGRGIDMNKGNDVRSILGPLGKLGREIGCTFIVVRHFNKSRDGSASQKGAGSVDFRNAARSVLQVIHADGITYLALEKTNYAARAKTLTFSIEGGKVVWGESSDMTADEIHSENQASTESRSALEEAIEFLTIELTNGGKPSKDILRTGRESGHSDKTLRRAKDKLGVKVTKLATCWMWEMPKVQDGQDSLNVNREKVSHLDHLGANQQLEATFI